MKVCDIVDILNLSVLSGGGGLDKDVNVCYTSDILSDVMCSAKENSVWITLQTNKNIIAVAVVTKISAIILVKNVMSDKDVIELSEDEQIPILRTMDDAFTISGKLYELLKK